MNEVERCIYGNIPSEETCRYCSAYCALREPAASSKEFSVASSIPIDATPSSIDVNETFFQRFINRLGTLPSFAERHFVSGDYYDPARQIVGKKFFATLAPGVCEVLTITRDVNHLFFCRRVVCHGEIFEFHAERDLVWINILFELVDRLLNEKIICE